MHPIYVVLLVDVDMQLQPFLSPRFVPVVLYTLNVIFFPLEAFDYLLSAAIFAFQTMQHNVLHS
jgi:hypothetical protein